MFFRTLRDLARPQIVAIFDVLKRSDGLAVGDIAEALKMSYMGVKQYCVELEKRGYLDTWRRAKETGRPELTYRLTAKAQVLFPQHSNELSLEILDAVRQLHGPTAAEKILYQYFLKKTEAYAKKIKGKSLIERATSLARLRDAEAHCAQVDYDPRHGLRLTEFHSPLAELIKAYPSVAKMEEAMLSRLLQAPVQREMSAVSGLTRITFLVAGATLPPPAPPSTTVRTKVAAKRPAKEAVATGEEASADSALSGLLPTEQAAPAAAAAAEPAPEGAPAIDPVLQAEVPAPGLLEPTPPLGCEQAPAGPSTAPAPAVTAVEVATVEVAAVEKTALKEEPLLFTPPTQPVSPRAPVRTVAPVRAAAKPADPLAEELFLSL